MVFRLVLTSRYLRFAKAVTCLPAALDTFIPTYDPRDGEEADSAYCPARSVFR